MNKTLSTLLILLTLTLSTSCRAKRTVTQDPATFDPDVTINGITWATRNVDAPGTFAANPEDAGMFFQWNRRKGWNAIDEEVEGWDSSHSEGTKWYAENDPCPEGWRVPSSDELFLLRNAGSVRFTKNGIDGRLFGVAPYQLFLPATGWRHGYNGSLGGVGERGGYWSWSRTQSDSVLAPNLGFGNSSVRVNSSWRKFGLSIRCVKIN